MCPINKETEGRVTPLNLELSVLSIHGTCWHNWNRNCVENVILLEKINVSAMNKEAERRVRPLNLEFSVL